MKDVILLLTRGSENWGILIIEDTQLDFAPRYTNALIVPLDGARNHDHAEVVAGLRPANRSGLRTVKDLAKMTFLAPQTISAYLTEIRNLLKQAGYDADEILFETIPGKGMRLRPNVILKV